MDLGKGFVPGARVYFIGIKGTGMCALAEFLHNRSVFVSGSDGKEVFYTDAILKELGIPYHESFEASHIGDSKKIDLVIHSDAYTFDKNPEMAEVQRLGIPICKYSEALGAYSELFDSSGITGVHGKTTITAMAGTLMRGAGLPMQVLVGSAVKGFNNRSTLNLGDRYFIAETDEYRRHFLSFKPQRIVLSAVEPDHQDYFPDYISIQEAFLEYLRKLPAGGELFFCADDPGATETAEIISRENRGVKIIPYGFSAPGNWGIESYSSGQGRSLFKIRGFPGDLELRVPGKHSCLNAVAALALTSSLVYKEFGGWDNERQEKVREALKEFQGSRRRSEVLGEAQGILFMDDYGHHPTEVKTTLAGFKEFFGRPLIVSFMSHTYTRTAALLDEFAASFESADLLVLHKIYGSAREHYSGGVTGFTLFEKVKAAMGDRVYYIE
jgi:UDP-N-acetylmuramate--alanine ligase